MSDRATPEEIERGARAVYEAARQGIASDPWETLPDWRRWRWKCAYQAAIAVREDRPTRPARTVRVERVA